MATWQDHDASPPAGYGRGSSLVAGTAMPLYSDWGISEALVMGCGLASPGDLSHLGEAKCSEATTLPAWRG